MALPYESGFLGQLSWITSADPDNPLNAPEWNANITFWKLHYGQKMIDTTIMGQADPVLPGHQAMIAGISSWSTEVEFLMPAVWDEDSTVQVGVFMKSYGLQDVEVQLLHNPSNGYEGVARIASISIDAPLDGPVRGLAVLVGSDPRVGLTIVGNTVFPGST